MDTIISCLARAKIFVLARPLWLYCLFDEVLQCGEIMPDEKKKLTFLFISSDILKNQRIFSPKLHKFLLNLFIFTIKSHFPTFFIFLRPESISYFFFLWRGTKHPCRSSSTKQYTESGSRAKTTTLEKTLWANFLRIIIFIGLDTVELHSIVYLPFFEKKRVPLDLEPGDLEWPIGRVRTSFSWAKPFEDAFYSIQGCFIVSTIVTLWYTVCSRTSI